MAAPPPVPPIADADRLVTYSPTTSTGTFAVPFPVFGDGSDLAIFWNGTQVAPTSYSFSSASGVPIAEIALPITDGQVTLGPISSGTLEIYGEWRPRQGILDTSPFITRRQYQQDLGQVVASLREIWTDILNNFPISKLGRAGQFLAFDAAGNPMAAVSATLPGARSAEPTTPEGQTGTTYVGFDAQGNPYETSTLTTTPLTVSSAMAPVIAASTYPAALSIMGFSSYFQTLIGATNASAFWTAISGTSFGASLASAANAAAALTTLGVSAFMQTVLVAANAAAALTALGLSSFGQAFVAAANAAAALTQLGLSSLAQNVVAQSTAQGWANTLGFASAKRQTVVGGPVNASGAPSFLPATSGSLAITSQLLTSSTPLVVTAAGGGGGAGANDLVGIATANLTWSSLAASTTNYLYVTVAANGSLTTGSTTLAPVYQMGGPPSTANTQFTFVIGSMIGYLGNGSAASQAYIVFVGEAITGSSSVTSTVGYAYNGVYVSPLLAVPAASSQTFVTHNLGYAPVAYELDMAFIAIATNAGGYPIGCEINAGPAFAGGGHGALTGVDQHQAAISTANSMSLSIPPYAGGTPTPITDSNWNLRLLAERSF